MIRVACFPKKITWLAGLAGLPGFGALLIMAFTCACRESRPRL